VIGNPPYKEKAKGRGGWIEGNNVDKEKVKARSDLGPPLSAWIPPKEWGVGAHAKHLRNLYVYFWRWATWKVFDHHPTSSSGIVSFITVAGFLNGPGFEAMRAYLRKTCDQIWVIDCSPEGHQPAVNSRIFQGVQQPVCIVMTARSGTTSEENAAIVMYRSLPEGPRIEKFAALKDLTLKSSGWLACSNNGRAPFLPASVGAWANFPLLEHFFVYNGSGVMPGRNWVIAPDTNSLEQRWNRLVSSKPEDKETLFHPHLRNGRLGDKHSQKVVRKALYGQVNRTLSVAKDDAGIHTPQQYGFRSFDRQFIIPDARLINQPNPTLWALHSCNQVYLTALSRTSASSGPALTFTGLVPDLDHYSGRGGRVFPLWSDATASEPNIEPGLIAYLAESLDQPVSAEDVMAYIAAIAAHPGYVTRFQEHLSTPGLRIPVTADPQLFNEVAALGRRVIWLHSFGERMADPSQGRPAQPPRLDDARRPTIPKDGAIPDDPEHMPDSIRYDNDNQRLHVGEGFVENVEPAVWAYNVSGKQVIVHWFSYRKRNRDRPLIGDRRPPSPLGDIQPDHWLSEYTTELISLLNILQMLVDIEPQQEALLDNICSSPLITHEMLEASCAFSSQSSSISSRTDNSHMQGSIL
jgi:predicted helicase